MASKKTGIMVVVPAFGQQCFIQTAQTLYLIAQFLTFKRIPNEMAWISAADIAEVRNIIITQWYEANKYSHILFIDADMAFPMQLLRDMLDFDKELVGTFYARRQYPLVPVGKAINDDATPADLQNGHLEVAGVGGGIMIVAREVVTAIIKKYPELIDTKIAGHPGEGALRESGGRLLRMFEPLIDDRGLKLSEDLAFCERWRRCGGKVWANVNYHIGHIGPHEHTIRYADHIENNAKKLEAAA